MNGTTIVFQQLVSSVFRELWFTVPPTGADQREALERRVQQITAVVRPMAPVCKGEEVMFW